VCVLCQFADGYVLESSTAVILANIKALVLTH
jgi:hypothetical protein